MIRDELIGVSVGVVMIVTVMLLLLAAMLLMLVMPQVKTNDL